MANQMYKSEDLLFLVITFVLTWAGIVYWKRRSSRNVEVEVTPTPTEVGAKGCKFCSACGAELLDVGRFCHKCGKEVAHPQLAHKTQGRLDKDQKNMISGLCGSLLFLIMPNVTIGPAMSERVTKYLSAIADPVGWVALIAIFVNMYCVYIRNYFAVILLSALAAISFLMEALAVMAYANDPPAFVRVEPAYGILWIPVVLMLLLAYSANKKRITQK